jgi:hypothetical protein
VVNVVIFVQFGGAYDIVKEVEAEERAEKESQSG